MPDFNINVGDTRLKAPPTKPELHEALVKSAICTIGKPELTTVGPVAFLTVSGLESLSLCLRGAYSPDERMDRKHELGFFGIGYLIQGVDSRLISIVDQVIVARYDVPTEVSRKVFTANIWANALNWAESQGKQVVWRIHDHHNVFPVVLSADDVDMMQSATPVGGIDFVVSTTHEPIHIAGYSAMGREMENIGGIFVVRGDPADMIKVVHQGWNESEVKTAAGGFAYILNGIAYVTKGDIIDWGPVDELTKEIKRNRG